jgi:apolipoprotein N-acyltransferase
VILNWILAIASSALLVLLFPQYSLIWLAPIALTPLLIACAREDRWRWRFALGYAAGFAYWFGLCHWVQATLSKYGGISGGAAWALFALMCLAKAVQMGVFAALAGPLFRSPLAVPAIAALWVVVEWTHAWTGFEWLNLGNAGTNMTVPLRLAPITGVWGLSFTFALMSAGIACLILRLPRVWFAWLLLLPGLYLLPPIPPVERGAAAAILAQPNISDDAEWSPDLVEQTRRRLTMLSLSPVLSRDADIDLVVWPEMPAPFYDSDPAFTGMVAKVAAASNASVLTGVVSRAQDGAPLNSAMLTGPDGRIISRYDKVHLVPFGEFVPWPLGALTKKVSSEAGDFETGNRVVVSSVGQHRIGTFICYESVFPEYVRKFAGSGAEVLFNLSNDSWFGKSAARYQHLQIVRMRAAENQRWILRATNNGITAAIDPAGRVVRVANEYEELAARFRYQYRKDLTLYTRFGDWFVAVCLLLVLAVGSTRVAIFAKNPPQRI